MRRVHTRPSPPRCVGALLAALLVTACAGNGSDGGASDTPPEAVQEARKPAPQPAPKPDPQPAEKPEPAPQRVPDAAPSAPSARAATGTLERDTGRRLETGPVPEPSRRWDTAGPVRSAPPGDAGPPISPADMAAARRLIRDHGFAPGDVGFLLADARGRQLAAHNPGQAFIPASVAKLPTAVAALEVLGGDRRFRTSMAARGEVRQGRLSGDLWLVGGGDPLLSADGLVHLCRELRDRGVRRVAGNFYYDATRYRERRAIRDDQPVTAGYNPGVSALSVNFNRLRARWGVDERGVPPAFTVPPVPSVTLSLDRRPAVGRESGSWLPDPDSWRLSYGARGSGSAWLPLKDPARVAAEATRRVCARTGVNLPAPQPKSAPDGATTVAAHPSPPMHEVVRSMLRYSNNLVAELTGLAAGRALSGQQRVGLADSAQAVADWFARTVPGADWSSFAPGNHSGLNAEGRVTPAQVAALLRFAADRRYGRDGRTLMELLPTAGLGGRLGSRLRFPDTALGVWAKTGTMNFASGLAGYLPTTDGRPRVFAVFVNDKPLRRAYDANPGQAGWSSRTGGWRYRAKQLEAALVRLWVDDQETDDGATPTAMLRRRE